MGRRRRTGRRCVRANEAMVRRLARLGRVTFGGHVAGRLGDGRGRRARDRRADRRARRPRGREPSACAARSSAPAQDVARAAGKLANESFVARAKEEVVEGERAKLAAAEQEKTALEAAIAPHRSHRMSRGACAVERSAPHRPMTPGVRALIRLALTEDVGSGDLTTRATVARTTQATGPRRRARSRWSSPAWGCSTRSSKSSSRSATPGPAPRRCASASVPATAAARSRGATLCVLDGDAWGVLTLERTFLNFLGHLSGVATETARVVGVGARRPAARRASSTRARPRPGWRLLEKYAVALRRRQQPPHGPLRRGADQGQPHRRRRRHRRGGACGARAAARAGVRVEVECDTMEQVARRARRGRHGPAARQLHAGRGGRRGARRSRDAREIEVSGGVTIETVVAYAKAGPDSISLGRLTHSARAADVSMEVALLA